MNTKILLASAIVAFTVSGFAAQPLLSPRAAGNQPKVAANADAPAITIATVETKPALLSPRAAGNQIKVVKGTATETTPAKVCRQNMGGTPRAVAECSSHATMPMCTKVVAQQDQ